jgi:succinoglycan biosynthesis protein ExoM
MKVVVTLCTRERPELLRECLSSLADQERAPGVQYSLVVVENDDRPQSREMVEGFAKERGLLHVTYSHEPRLGIPFARNRALAIALEQDPDWIGFIDDDEVASPNWLTNFVRAATSVPCDVFQGPVEYLYPASTPAWKPLSKRKHQATGLVLRTAATSNTFMRARIARRDGLGLRFNEDMRFTGGSDNEYFYRAADLGARICWMNDAVVSESVPEKRTTLRWQLERSLRVAANTVFIHRQRHDLLGVIAKCGPKYLSRLLFGAIAAVGGAALCVVAMDRGRRMMFLALRDISSGLGGLGAFLKLYTEPYRSVETQTVSINRSPIGAR